MWFIKRSKGFFVFFALIYTSFLKVCNSLIAHRSITYRSTLYDKTKPVQVEIEFLPTKKTVVTTVGKNLIDLGKSIGVNIPFECRKGTCNKCKVKIEGKSILACKSYSTWNLIPSSSQWNLISKGTTVEGFYKNDVLPPSIQKIQVTVPIQSDKKKS